MSENFRERGCLVHIRARAHTHICTHAHTHTRARAHTHTHMRTHIHTHTRTHAHIRTNAHIHTYSPYLPDPVAHMTVGTRGNRRQSIKSACPRSLMWNAWLTPRCWSSSLPVRDISNPLRSQAQWFDRLQNDKKFHFVRKFTWNWA